MASGLVAGHHRFWLNELKKGAPRLAKPKKRRLEWRGPLPPPELARTAFRIRLVEEICATLRRLFAVGGVVLVVYYLYRTAQVVAGTTTLVNVVVKLLADVKVSEWAAYLLAFLATGYGLVERKSRQRTVKRMGSRVKELESKWDRKRSSSRLTESGQTRPEDS